jgi:Protein of unknown function (DUF3040)
MLSWEDRARLADMEEELAAEDPDFADRMRRPRRPWRVPPRVATTIALAVATPVLALMPPLPMIVLAALIIVGVEATYRLRRRFVERE